MNESDVVVVAAGPGPAVAVPAAGTVIAADGGADRAAALGLPVHVVIGDLDSISPSTLARCAATGARVIRHPEAKDATDLELALDEAVRLGSQRALVVASAEGRLDHLLALLLLLGADRYASLELDAIVGSSSVHVVRSRRALTGTPGDVVSLLALGGPASGVRTEGLAYPLSDERLEAGSSRGVSNVFAAERAEITVDHGVLLAVRPAGAAA